MVHSARPVRPHASGTAHRPYSSCAPVWPENSRVYAPRKTAQSWPSCHPCLLKPRGIMAAEGPRSLACEPIFLPGIQSLSALICSNLKLGLLFFPARQHRGVSPLQPLVSGPFRHLHTWTQPAPSWSASWSFLSTPTKLMAGRAVCKGPLALEWSPPEGRSPEERQERVSLLSPDPSPPFCFPSWKTAPAPIWWPSWVGDPLQHPPPLPVVVMSLQCSS